MGRGRLDSIFSSHLASYLRFFFFVSLVFPLNPAFRAWSTGPLYFRRRRCRLGSTSTQFRNHSQVEWPPTTTATMYGFPHISQMKFFLSPRVPPATVSPTFRSALCIQYSVSNANIFCQFLLLLFLLFFTSANSLFAKDILLVVVVVVGCYCASHPWPAETMANSIRTLAFHKTLFNFCPTRAQRTQTKGSARKKNRTEKYTMCRMRWPLICCKLTTQQNID